MSAPSSEKPSAAVRVTQAIEAALQRGVRPWIKPWRDDAAGAPLVLPRRANGEPYHGVNVIALWATAQQRGFVSPYWFTFRQTQTLGAQVRKGEHGAFVVFYKPVQKREQEDAKAEDNTTARRVLRGYVVFNRDQIDGLEGFSAAPSPPSPPDRLARLFARVPAIVRFGGSRAFYASSSDHIQMPPADAFTDIPQFYATLGHELGHWTRHPSRLDRDYGAKRFGDAGYALEELTAEMCAAVVGAVIGLPADHIEDHAAYIGEWIGVLQDNPNGFLTAAAKAQIAADYLLRLMGEAPASATADE
jgi:antirestriction protein ArdC